MAAMVEAGFVWCRSFGSFVSEDEVVEKVKHRLTDPPFHCVNQADAFHSIRIALVDFGEPIAQINVELGSSEQRQVHRNWAKACKEAKAGAKNKEEEVQRRRRVAVNIESSASDMDVTEMLRNCIIEMKHLNAGDGEQGDELTDKLSRIYRLTIAHMPGGAVVPAGRAAKRQEVGVVPLDPTNMNQGAALPISIASLRTLAGLMARVKREAKVVQTEARALKAHAGGLEEKMCTTVGLIQDCQTDLASILRDATNGR